MSAPQLKVDWNNLELEGVIDTGWRCACCFEVAQVHMIDVTLCSKHAKEYNFGYGKNLKQMREEYEMSQKGL